MHPEKRHNATSSVDQTRMTRDGKGADSTISCKSVKWSAWSPEENPCDDHNHDNNDNVNKGSCKSKNNNYDNYDNSNLYKAKIYAHLGSWVLTAVSAEPEASIMTP